MIRIGVVNIDTSHPMAFSKYLLQGDRARYVAVYNDSFRGDDEVEAFMQKRGLERRCDSIAELAERTDIGFIQDANWDLHVEHALPFLERGKPVFIDKPLVGNLADCRRLEALARDGAAILGCSSLRYAREIADFLAEPEEERGEIVHVYGSAGVDEFNYGVHTVEGLGPLTGPGAVSCQFAGRAEKGDKACESFLVRYASGLTALYETFLGTWQPFAFQVMTTKTTRQFVVDSGAIYGALLDRICEFMETGRPMASVAELTESVKIMLAGRLSRERGGAPVAIADIPPDDPGFDGTAFTEGYAATALQSKMYLTAE